MLLLAQTENCLELIEVNLAVLLSIMQSDYLFNLVVGNFLPSLSLESLFQVCSCDEICIVYIEFFEKTPERLLI